MPSFGGRALAPCSEFSSSPPSSPQGYSKPFPPLAFLTADMLYRTIRGQINDLRRPAFITLVAIWSIIVAALGAAPWLAARKFEALPTRAMTILTIIGIIYAVRVFILFARRR